MKPITFTRNFGKKEVVTAEPQPEQKVDYRLMFPHLPPPVMELDEEEIKLYYSYILEQDLPKTEEEKQAEIMKELN